MRIEASYFASVTFVAAIVLGSCGQLPQSSQPEVTQVWTRLPVLAGRPATAYFVLRGGPKLARLTSVTSPKATRIELHEGGMSGDMATMRPIEGVDVPAGAMVSFAPGGDHAMIFGLDPAVRRGSLLPLSFRFADGRSIDVPAQVLSSKDPAPKPAD